MAGEGSTAHWVRILEEERISNERLTVGTMDVLETFVNLLSRLLKFKSLVGIFKLKMFNDKKRKRWYNVDLF